MEVKTLKELAAEALSIQDACNLCGLAQRFAKVQIELGEYTKGTEERNRHPITVLWLDKFNSLAGIQAMEGRSSERTDTAYNAVYALLGKL